MGNSLTQSLSLYICVCICVYLCMCSCMYACACVCVCVCVHAVRTFRWWWWSSWDFGLIVALLAVVVPTAAVCAWSSASMRPLALVRSRLKWFANKFYPSTRKEYLFTAFRYEISLPICMCFHFFMMPGVIDSQRLTPLFPLPLSVLQATTRCGAAPPFPGGGGRWGG